MSRTRDALVLAGDRAGAVDALAGEHGLSHKALVPVGGRPLIAHVLKALDAAGYERITVCIDDAQVLTGLPEVQALAGRIAYVDARPSLMDSIAAGIAVASFPLLITTADNVLLTPAILAEFDDAVGMEGIDAAAAFARRERVLEAHPDGQRRFYRFSDGEWSNCNLYWLGRQDALSAAGIFREGGQFAKHPARMLAAFGVLNLILFRLQAISLAGMMRRLSRQFRLHLRAVEISDGAAAIDVDNPRTHGVAEQILKARCARMTAIPPTSPALR